MIGSIRMKLRTLGWWYVCVGGWFETWQVS